MILQHSIERCAAEVRWHEELVARLPKIVADFRNGVGGPTFRLQNPESKADPS
jgi:hypothetical protein